VPEAKRRGRRGAASDSPVLLLGETGTGKELLAHAIHAASARAHKAFVSINSAAIPETLLEAEFFGTAPGAFTGAERKGRSGKLQLAEGGTLFLDEIGDMPLALQSKLLRVLQEKEYEPVGSNQMLRSDVRIIAATSIDLQAAMARGAFRADLYYRLNVLPIEVPPLRERLEDLPALCEAILAELGSQYELEPEAQALLGRHGWPGNIRELRNVLERATLLADQPRLNVADLIAPWAVEPGGSGRAGAGLSPGVRAVRARVDCRCPGAQRRECAGGGAGVGVGAVDAVQEDGGAGDQSQ
jgi:transcriptional regulator with PAS, ATPase and Fis domain